MARYLNREELAKLTSKELIKYQDAMNQKLIDDAPAAIRPRLGAILLMVEMECSLIEDPILRTRTANEKLVAAMMEFKDELNSQIDNPFSEDNDGDDKCLK